MKTQSRNTMEVSEQLRTIVDAAIARVIADNPSLKPADVWLAFERVVSDFLDPVGMVIGQWPPETLTEPHEAYFHQAWEMWPERGRKRSSKKNALVQWQQLWRKVGNERLLDAVNAYVLSEDAMKANGEYVPGLDRWLKLGKWEAWLEAPKTPTRIGFV